MREVTEMDCLIFVGQAYKFAEKLGGYVSFQSAAYADIKTPDGDTHSLIGPAVSDGDEWISGNRRLMRHLAKR